MYNMKMNYLLVGKERYKSKTFVTEEERKQYGDFYQKETIVGHFIYPIDDIDKEYLETDFDGVGTQILLFDIGIVEYSDLEIGKNYVLLTDGNVVLYCKQIKDDEFKERIFVNDASINVSYPQLYKTIAKANT